MSPQADFPQGGLPVIRVQDRPTAARKPLGQLRPANTNAATLYAPRAGTLGVATSIIVANTTAGALTFRLFVDADGSTMDETTAIYFDKSVAANDSFAVPIDSVFGWAIRYGGSIGVRSSSGNGLTFTAFGYEELGTT